MFLQTPFYCNCYWETFIATPLWYDTSCLVSNCYILNTKIFIYVSCKSGYIESSSESLFQEEAVLYKKGIFSKIQF